MNQSNPLSKHFRQPAIYLKLPSKGKHWPDGSIELPVAGELPVYPMTTRDEITLRTPDALMNGAGMVEVIKSCIPNIVDPWQIPSTDVDACLIAIRIASYGNEMTVETTCPKCKHNEPHTVNLSPVLDNIVMPDYSDPVIYRDLRIKLKPQPYFATNKFNMIRYKEQKILDVLAKTDIAPEERELNIRQITEEMIEINNESLAASTEYVQTADGIFVSETEYIKELYANAESALIRAIQDRFNKISEDAGIKPFDTECSNCENKFKSSIEFDYANFFAQGS